MRMTVAFFAICVAIILPTLHAATQHVVGGSSGWTNLGDYTTWASGQTFTVGDTLLFNYDSSSHSLAQVDKSGYDGCSAANAITTYNDGSTTVPLTTAGSLYFMCPSIGHCSGGMKLAVTVVSASTSSPSSSSPPPPSARGAAASPPPPKTKTETPASSPGNGGPSAFYHPMSGSLVILGTLMFVF